MCWVTPLDKVLIVIFMYPMICPGCFVQISAQVRSSNCTPGFRVKFSPLFSLVTSYPMAKLGVKLTKQPKHAKNIQKCQQGRELNPPPKNAVWQSPGLSCKHTLWHMQSQSTAGDKSSALSSVLEVRIVGAEILFLHFVPVICGGCLKSQQQIQPETWPRAGKVLQATQACQSLGQHPLPLEFCQVTPLIFPQHDQDFAKHGWQLPFLASEKSTSYAHIT